MLSFDLVDPHRISGSCHVAIVLLAQIHNHRELLPQTLQPEYLSTTDLATVVDIERAIGRDLWCLRTFDGRPSGFVVGERKNLGVFFWSPQSTISKLYRGRHTPGLLGEVGNSTDGVGNATSTGFRGVMVGSAGTE